MADANLAAGSRFRGTLSDLTPIPYDSGNVRTLKLPVSFPYKGMVLRLSGSLVVGTATATAVGSELPLELIQKIEIVADGRKTLMNLSGRDAFRMGHILRGKQGEISAPVLTVGTNAFAATIVLDHQALRFMRPVDSHFNPRPYQNVELRITWGTVSNIATPGGGGTVSISAATQLTCMIAETTAGIGLQTFDKLYTYDELSVTATQSALALDVPRSGLLAGILIRTTRDAACVDNLINRVSLKSDYKFAHMDALRWADIQRFNVLDFQLDGGATAGAQIPGYAYLDLTEDGMLTSALNTWDLNKLQLIFDVTRTSGTELIRVTYQFFEPLAVAA